jgi:flagellar biosynthetic protein FliQ
MTIEQASVLLQETVRLSLWLSAPILATALISGLVISILQAATQVNEQTLSFVPKIVLTLGVFALLFPWMMATLVDFGHQLLSQIAAGGAP